MSLLKCVSVCVVCNCVSTHTMSYVGSFYCIHISTQSTLITVSTMLCFVYVPNDCDVYH